MPSKRYPVSVEAISWALNLAPVPADSGGQPSSACKFVLVGLANHAGPDGTGAFPSVATLVRYTGLSERTAGTCLDRLEAGGIVSPCDPGIVAARIKRAGRPPQGRALNLGMVRDDLAEADTVKLERQFPGLAARPAIMARPGPDDQADGGQPPHPAPEPASLRITPPARRGRCTPRGEWGATSTPTGCNRRSHGVQRWHPNRPGNHPPNRPPPPHARGAPATATTAGGGGPAGEFFAAPGDGWPLTATQRARLAPAVRAARGAGWMPHAVLAARLSPGELPPPRGPRLARPPWRGQCDQVTRMPGFDGDEPRPCPRCTPATTPQPRQSCWAVALRPHRFICAAHCGHPL